MAPPKPIIVTDTAEQRAFTFPKGRVLSVRGSLWSGDYAIVAPDVPEYVTRRRRPTKKEEAARPAFPVLYAPEVGMVEHVAVSTRADGTTARVLLISVRVERKSLDDLTKCCTHDRERFEEELARLSTFGPGRTVVVIEGSLQDVAARRYTSKVIPKSVVGSTIAWGLRFGVGFLWAGNRPAAARWTERYLCKALEDYLVEQRAEEPESEATEEATG